MGTPVGVAVGVTDGFADGVPDGVLDGVWVGVTLGAGVSIEAAGAPELPVPGLSLPHATSANGSKANPAAYFHPRTDISPTFCSSLLTRWTLASTVWLATDFPPVSVSQFPIRCQCFR
ncbi:hypothetical protein GCM10027269_08260 [Kribbella endophytica]